ADESQPVRWRPSPGSSLPPWRSADEIGVTAGHLVHTDRCPMVPRLLGAVLLAALAALSQSRVTGQDGVMPVDLGIFQGAAEPLHTARTFCHPPPAFHAALTALKLGHLKQS